ncbi:MAG: OmpA family protein [Ignavibacteria bacterium]|nr:OmpA family protein [Ignavibacteria bacterium]
MIALGAILSSAATTQAQDVQLKDWRLGVTGSATLNMHSGEFSSYDGFIECGSFSTANTLGWMAGNAIWFPVMSNVAISGRLQYYKANGNFTSPNSVQPYVEMPDGSLVRMESDYNLNTALDYVNLDVLAQWYFTPKFFVGLGPTIGLNTRAAYEQNEVIMSPNVLEFSSGGKERTILAQQFSANGGSVLLRAGLQLMVGYDIPVADRLIVTPELGYTYSFLNVVSNTTWKVNTARAGVTISYVLSAPEVIREPAPEMRLVPQTAQVAASVIPVVNMDVESTLPSGEVLAGADVVLMETRCNEVVPLLPFVFFETSNATIPSRYFTKNSEFTSDADMQDSAIGVYHHLLNIVGYRMQQFPDATISIVGHREVADGDADSALPVQRALAVKQQLMTEWNIADSRIRILGRGLPAVVSNRKITDGQMENRRAEISASDPRILAMVKRADVKREVEPASVKITPRITNSSAVAQLQCTVLDAKGTSLYSSSVATDGAATWNPSATALATTLAHSTSQRGIISLTATTNGQEKLIAEQSIPLRKRTRSMGFADRVVNDSIVEQFRLIFCDFDSPAMSPFNQPMIDMIRSRMRTTSVVGITGLTDRIGGADYNLDLSSRRAEALSDVVKERIVPAKVITKGIGATLIHDNDLPEGRFYNRTVLIEITTPVDAE